MSKILITGGCGYIGSYLVPVLLERGHEIVVMDLQWFGNTLPQDDDNLLVVKEDIRDNNAYAHYVQGCDAVIHLACISNDVSLELNPELGKSINFDCFPALVQAAAEAGVQRFIYASSSSVYGVKMEEKVTEDLSLEPMTDYARYKAECEPILFEKAGSMCATIVRPGAVCGYAPRLRLDLVVNLLTAQAVENKKITVLGGEQLRSHIHVNDMVRAYVALLDAPTSQIDREIFNVSHQNVSVMDVAKTIQRIVGEKLGEEIVIDVQPTEDKRSYHICSDKIREAIGFEATASYEHAINLLTELLRDGNIAEPSSSQYHNIKRMQELEVV